MFLSTPNSSCDNVNIFHDESKGRGNYYFKPMILRFVFKNFFIYIYVRGSFLFLNFQFFDAAHPHFVHHRIEVICVEFNFDNSTPYRALRGLNNEQRG